VVNRLVGLLVMVTIAAGVVMYPTTLATSPEVEEPPPFPIHQHCPEPQWVNEEIQPEEGEIMSIDKDQLRQLIRDVLVEIDLHSDSAEELLMMTAATESHLGRYIEQVGGPAEGVFQAEPATIEDIWDNYLGYRPELPTRVIDVIGGGGLSKFALRANLTYQIIMARIHYLRVKARLPAADDIGGLASYWKTHYNTKLGKGTVKKAIESYEYYVKEVV